MRNFADLPLSQATLAGLRAAYYTRLTDIQARALPPALKGRDVLGAARTGSGKTLAFLVPILEVLLRKKWGQLDGLGALVISPTRELVPPATASTARRRTEAKRASSYRLFKFLRSCVRLAASTSSPRASSSAARTCATSKSDSGA